MKLTNRIYLVGSGTFGFDLTHNLDCHVYLIDGGDELALVDAGIGLSTDEILENIKAEGFSLEKIKYLLLTHTHADHAGGAAWMKQVLGCDVLVSKDSADFLRNGDEDAINLTFGKQAGFYPEDYRFEACGVDRELAEGDIISVGDCKIKVLDTPGHCLGHLAFYFESIAADLQTTLIAHLFDGDCIFWGGKILLQNIYDCILQDYVNSIKKLAKLSVDVFLPGHMTFSLKNGQRHIDAAAQAVNKLGVPPNLI
ncbi:MBL fold metallo-hydrolase [Candidatus Poribacteria bacterium]|nr:MBL fold metallo-hydrolase [Candidatus Poribacteria bacterium]